MKFTNIGGATAILEHRGKRILFDPWLIALPGAALCILVLAVNLLGDALRDAVDPKFRQRKG